MSDEKWIALLSFVIFVLGLLAVFPPLAQWAQWLTLAASLVAGFVSYWFGVKPIRAAKKSSDQPQ
jgi:phosphatidylglycerophosphate synthase